jgi:hypothetical protein
MIRIHSRKVLKTTTAFLVVSGLLVARSSLLAGDLEFTETLELPECHSIGWVRANMQAKDQKGWNGVLDEAKWGTPSAQQLVVRNWDWKVTDAQWLAAVREKGKREAVTFDLWIPGDLPYVRGVVAISGHGSGETLFRHPDLRQLARELHLAIFKFVGNPMQRGFWPKSLLYERLNALAVKAQHLELQHAPLFLYGHSNGTGFSALFPATEGSRVWGWVSMRPGITFQVYQPGGAQVPGLVIFGEDDHFFARPSKDENLAVVPAMRKQYNALWNIAVEPKTGHGPGEKTWPLVFSFLRHSFAARVPADADPRQGPVSLRKMTVENGYLGQNWSSSPGGYQALPIAPYASFEGDKASASWLINAEYAADWHAFQRGGEVAGEGANAVANEPLARLLAGHQCRLSATVYRYEDQRLLESRKLVADGVSKTRVGEAVWTVSMRRVALDEAAGVADLDFLFRLEEGKSPQTGVGVELAFSAWSTNNYVFLPASAYNGNRFLVLKEDPWEFSKDPKNHGVDFPVTVKDILHLTPDGRGAIEEQTGNLTTPAMGWQSPSLRKGFLLLTTQGTRLGNLGLSVRERMDEQRAVFKVVAPPMRSVRAVLGGKTIPEPTDHAPDWKAGDELSIRVRLYFFEAPAVQDLFNRFADVRKDLLKGEAVAPTVPMSHAWELVKEKQNRCNWEEEHGYYRLHMKNPEHNKDRRFFGLGWAGGAMNTFAYLAAAEPLTRERAFRNLDLVIRGGQTPSGFYNVLLDGTTWAKGRSLGPGAENLVIVSKEADALYFFLKQLAWVQRYGTADEQRRAKAWEGPVRRLADAFVKVWENSGQFGHYIDVDTCKVVIGATTCGALAPGALAFASQYFNEPRYLEVAKAAARLYYQRDVQKGYTTAAAGDVWQSPEAMSAYWLLDSFVVLHEITGEAEWVRYAEAMAKQYMSWVVSYQYQWPESSTCARLKQPTTGAVWASAQNKVACAGNCTASTDALFKLYRMSGDLRYLELLREIYRLQPMWVSRPDKPLQSARRNAPPVDIPAGYIFERIQMGDWQWSTLPVGEIPRNSAKWAESAVLLAWVEVPGLYIQPDTGLVYPIDHIEARGTKENGKFVVEVKNPTSYQAKVKVLSESSEDAKKPLGFLKIPLIKPLVLEPGETKRIEY